MTTTAIFAEILAIGAQTAIILGIGLASVVDVGGHMTDLEPWAALVSLGIVAMAYVLGVAVDRLADSSLGAIRNRLLSRTAQEHGDVRLRVMERSSPLSAFLEYQRSRMRLMRGTVFNLALAIPVLNLVLIPASPGPSALAVVGGNLLLVAALAACWYAYLAIGAAHDRWLHLAARPDGDAGSSEHPRQ